MIIFSGGHCTVGVSELPFRDRLARYSHAAGNDYLLDASTDWDVLRFLEEQRGSIEVSLNVFIARLHARLMEKLQW